MLSNSLESLLARVPIMARDAGGASDRDGIGSGCATGGPFVVQHDVVSHDPISLLVDTSADDHFCPAEGCVPRTKLCHQQDQVAGPRQPQKRSDSNDCIMKVESPLGATCAPVQFLPHQPLLPVVLPYPSYFVPGHLNTLLPSQLLASLPCSSTFTFPPSELPAEILDPRRFGNDDTDAKHSYMFPEPAGAVTTEEATMAAIRDMAVSITIADPALPDCPLIGCSDGFEALTGYSRSRIIGRNCRFLQKGVCLPQDVRQQLWNVITHGGEFIGVLSNVRKNKMRFQNLLHMTTLTVKGKRYIVGIQADTTHIKVDPRHSGHRAALKQAADRIWSETLDAWHGSQVEKFSIHKFSDLMKLRFPRSYARERNKDIRIAEDSVDTSSRSDTSCFGLEEKTQPATSDTKDVRTTADSRLKTIGGADHPDNCVECCFHFFGSVGCRQGENCKFCHHFHPRGNAKKNRRLIKRLISSEVEPSADSPDRVEDAEQVESGTVPKE